MEHQITHQEDEISKIKKEVLKEISDGTKPKKIS